MIFITKQEAQFLRILVAFYISFPAERKFEPNLNEDEIHDLYYRLQNKRPAPSSPPPRLPGKDT